MGSVLRRRAGPVKGTGRKFEKDPHSVCTCLIMESRVFCFFGSRGSMNAAGGGSSAGFCEEDWFVMADRCRGERKSIGYESGKYLLLDG